MSDPELSPSSGEVALRVRDLGKTFTRGSTTKEVLNGLSFDVHPAQVVSLLGANGAGKTTLVNIASTLMKPTSGSVMVCGTDVVSQPRQVRRHISLTGQFAAVDGELTGPENLVFFGRLNGLPRARAAERAGELLEMFRLADAGDARVSTYSGGMRRRLDIAASLIVQPRLLFLDEPTTGLDPLSRRELWEMVEDLRSRGVAILLTTQYLDEAERLSDDIVLLREGRKVSQGSPSQLRRQFGHAICRITLDDAASAQHVATSVLPEALGRAEDEFEIDALEVSFPARGDAEDLAVAVRAITSWDLVIVSASIDPPSLDDVFIGSAFTADAGTGQEDRS
ncbi:MAG: ATP-binding cassette domain-containing protein [Brachybacterium sp.]|uniref:ATP-binding cassette domain-containing protein n=1 Tax=Brachybacterium sp. AOP35-5H-19 TaxID=3457685 RepID=UPI003FEB4ACF